MLSSNIISCKYIYNVNRIFKIVVVFLSAGNKQSVHIVSFPAGRMCSRPSAGHPTISQMCKNVNLLLHLNLDYIIFFNTYFNSL